jgi:hypothetical protein
MAQRLVKSGRLEPPIRHAGDLNSEQKTAGEYLFLIKFWAIAG